MDLFDYMRQENGKKESPLASRMRPTSLDEVVGQQHIIGKDKLLYRAIMADKISSIIFYGPPGTGKTTLAKVIANTTSAELHPLMRRRQARKTWSRSWKMPRTFGACMAKRPFFSLMRSTVLTRDSRITSCLLWKMGRSF